MTRPRRHRAAGFLSAKVLRSAPVGPAALDPAVARWLVRSAAQLDPDALRAEVEALAGPRSRLHWPDAMRRAERRVFDSLAQAGWRVERQSVTVRAGLGLRDHDDFRRTRYRNLAGANVVALKPGDERAALVVLAHLDTVRDSPGANDNTAAVVALLNLARLLAPLKLHRTVVLAVTDFEEVGLFGARALVSALRRERPLVAAINLETIGYVDSRPGSQRLPGGIGAVYPQQLDALRRRGFRGDFMALIHDGRAGHVAATYAAALAEVAGPHVPVPVPAPGSLARLAPLLVHAIPLVRDFARGDHVAFWEAGIPALQVTDTANFRYDAYHRSGDTPDRLDYKHLASVVAATAATIVALDSVSASV